MTESLATRSRLLSAAKSLFKRHGYHGAGLTLLLKEAGAPKGSFYFHFPDGKEQLAAEAAAVAGAEFAGHVARLLEAYPVPSEAVLALGQMLSRWLEKSGFVDGCPISTVCLEMTPQSASITQACQSAFASWQGLWRSHLVAAGHDASQAEARATTIVAAFEGAFILARAERSCRPFQQTADVLARLLAHADD